MSNRNSKLLLATLIINNIAVAALNDTGITTCSNATQNGLPCPVAGFPGQDAEYGTNAFDFTKIDANGNVMSVAATNHSCVQDNVTGLMWEVNTYNATFDVAPQFATQANAAKRCGHNDWRVPEPHELVSIVNYSVYGASIDGEYFPDTINVHTKYYWTNSSPNSSYSWIVDFYYGIVHDYYNDNGALVRVVRGGQWIFSLLNNNDGTISDQNTGLMWAKCSQGQTGTDCSGSATTMTWQQALQAADGLTLAGYSDWRLPNAKELQSLTDYTVYSPAISSSYFPNTDVINYYWTSSPVAFDSSDSWVVDFGRGGRVDGGSRGSNRGDSDAVRVVRSGQSIFLFSLSINMLGTGSGTITSNPAGINCGTVCAANFAKNTAVTLTATPAAGSTFGGWSGDADCSDGQVTMDANKSCTATFTLNPTATVPTVTTTAVTNLTQTRATLNGNVTSSSATASVSFDFGITTAYGESLAATPSQINSNTAVAVSANKTGLTCNTTYHYRVTATNSAGTSNGADQNFTTAACAPVVNPPTAVTGNATNIAAKGVTLNGMVNSNGAITTVIFELGPTTDYGMNINANPNVLDATALNVTVTANPTGLACKTTYNYRIKATNSAGPSNGANKQLTTADCPPDDEDKHARALIIGGYVQRDDETTLNNIMQTMQQAYSALGKQGYQNANNKEFIRVLWNGPAIRFPNGNFVPTEATDVSNFTSNTELTQWAQQASRLLIYMIGHGDTNIFYFDDNSDQILTTDIMKTWLNLVQPQTKAVPSDNELIFIYEACRSGSFLKPLADLNRIIMTSTTDNQQAMLLDNNSYSYGLWTTLGNGRDMKESLQRAILELGNRLQNPQLDATGDGQSDEITSVDKFCIGIKPNGMRDCIPTLDLPPKIEEARQITLNGENSANLWLKISANQAENVDDNWKAWAVINPPNIQPESSHGFYQLPTVTLTKDATKQKWSGDYNQFNTVGTYTISYYIQNNDGPSEPLVKTVTQFGGSSTQATLESPQQGSYESGIGLVRGWICQANKIEIQIDGGNKRQVAYGTARGDTQQVCGHPNTGFGYTYNWSGLSSGITHNLKAFADNVQFADVNFTTTNLGTAFLTGANGQHTLANFPATGKSATLKWSEPHQNFVISNATRTSPRLGPPQTRNGITGNLESPQAGSYESGIALIRGWVCQANSIELQIDGGVRRPVAYGTARGDTAANCNGNSNTGFGYVYNWNALGDGTHNLRLFVDNQEFTNVNFTVTTLGGNYLQGLSRDEAFNFNGRNIKVRWAEPHQNFVIVP